MYDKWDSWSHLENIHRSAIKEDLLKLKSITNCVRIYRLKNGLEHVPAVADELQMEVILSVNVTNQYANYTQENDSIVQRAIEFANRHSSITRILVGNEVLFFKRLTPQELLRYVRTVKQAVRQPVSIADVSVVFFQRARYAQLIQELDFIGLHIFPHWYNVASPESVNFVFSHLKKIQEMYPDKSLLIMEIGMPSGGLPSKGRVWPGVFRQAQFTREFAQQANARGIFFNYMEAFDQPWKANDGVAGANEQHQGLFDVHGEKKFLWQGPVLRHSETQNLLVYSLPLYTLWVLIILRLRISAKLAFGQSLIFWPLSIGTIAFWQITWPQVIYHSYAQAFFLLAYVLMLLVLSLTSYETLWNLAREEKET